MTLTETTAGSDGHPQRWDKLLEQLRQDGTIVETTVADLRADVAGYENVPTRSLQASVRRNVELSIRTIGRARSRALSR